MTWTLALPELALACAGLVILVAGVLPKQETFFPVSMACIGALLLAAVLVLGQPEGTALGGHYVADAFSGFMKLLAIAAAAIGILLSLDYNAKEGLGRFEFPLLMLLGTIGMMVMISANDLLSLYLGLELLSLPLYVIAAFNRDNARSAEAGLKYFVLGALASGLLLYGSSLVYGFAGTTNFDRLADAFSADSGVTAGVIVGIVFVIAGLAFKVSAVPFHMWTPDVYEGAPTPVTAFFAAAPKVAAIALLARVLIGPFGDLAAQWQQVITLVSLGSMILGGFAAIGQRNIKRLMAYSSIGHVGYALMGLAVANDIGLRGLLVYMAIYVAMNLGTFAVLIAMRRRGRAVEQVEDLAGLGRTDLGMAVWMAIFMFSMAGIPPLAGFFGKLYVFLAAVQAGFWTLAVVGVLTSVVSAYYYLRIVKVMFFDAPAGELDPAPASLTVVMAASGLFTLFFVLWPAPLLAAAQAAAAALLG
ncbi:NADH-quinone oxidoreductase subunit NuoN [Siccirubricoccus sp. KC 17139]|uniref:NADH-quinone oxidoreductase subunit N n=1 Tax=Siccirubricoccus soli TaxID=2899147 RepID=A0ABT1D662_9PROT|nr:NADH-quinone oxidoreductase subunit NuoN [Siccirubricoccus soli]MCO6416699.1 NADH-quinone oxidoreductase subunit NuoN [Siccirubricoccus soli]MCP2682834.1 NADH-quinone oxidoreductase subunit NuoN [Siccirubricoccus soli]